MREENRRSSKWGHHVNAIDRAGFALRSRSEMKSGNRRDKHSRFQETRETSSAPGGLVAMSILNIVAVAQSVRLSFLEIQMSELFQRLNL